MSEDRDWELFKQKLKAKTEIDLDLYKEPQMKRRINNLITRAGYKECSEYFDHVCGNKDDFAAFIEYLTINVSEFFRTPEKFSKLETDVIGRVVGEGFRAVAPHEHEGAPPAGSGHLGAQGVDLAGEDEWRAASQVVAHRFQGIRVRVGRLLGGGAIAPAGRGAWGVELVHHTGIIWPSACAPAPSMKQNAGPDGDRRTADGAPSTLSAPKRLRRARRSGRDPP